jgi:hypothetical protein
MHTKEIHIVFMNSTDSTSSSSQAGQKGQLAMYGCILHGCLMDQHKQLVLISGAGPVVHGMDMVADSRPLLLLPLFASPGISADTTVKCCSAKTLSHSIASCTK